MQKNQFAVLPSSLNDRPTFERASRSLGIEDGPIPCNARIWFSVCADNTSRVVIPAFSNARLAGATRFDKNPASGFLTCSHTGQELQSLLL